MRIPLPKQNELRRIVREALSEDLGTGDLTSRTAIDPKTQAKAFILAREAGVFAGGPIAAEVFQQVDKALKVKLLVREGGRFKRGTNLIEVRGNARSILSGERSALNFLQHLCSIATHTAEVVAAVRNPRVKVLATRKTLPGLRSFQKYAVQIGGGFPHRQGLFDETLLKENHIDIAKQKPKFIVQKMRASLGQKALITAEARNLREAEELIEGGAERILLDNMSPASLKKAVRHLKNYAKKLGKKIELEASGGIHLKNARQFAATGVDRISLGELTHSVRAMDLGLDIFPISVKS